MSRTTKCDQCGNDLSELTYNCDYCGRNHCQDHRLPENHECVSLETLGRPVSSKSDANAVLKGGKSLKELKRSDEKPYTVFEHGETVGTTPEPDYDSSPDVGVDGSVITGEDHSDINEDQKDGTRKDGYLAAIAFLALAIGILLLFVYT